MTTPRVERRPLDERQLTAIERFNRARRGTQRALMLAAESRETRMDAARRLEVLRREHDALVARAQAQLRASGELLARHSTLRAVVAYRHPWFAQTLTELLQRASIEVVDRVENGADAIGIAIAEQPDLVMVGDSLLMVPGTEVVREVREYCADAVIAARASSGDLVGALLDAGADTVVSHQMRPADVVEQVLAIVRRR
jgi:CheY-like chemotaxis protein